MEELEGRFDKKSGKKIGPYRNLYIYLIKGPVTEKDEAGFGETFVGNWVEGDVSFLFFTMPAREEIAGLTSERSCLELVDDYQFTYEQWQGEGPGTVKVENFLIVPPWMEMDCGEGVIQIILNPGVVFGNGLHPTTRDCLRALSYAGKKRPFDRLLDLGAGSGVLSLAAARIGAKMVLALDLNPLCVKTTIENVKLNDLDEAVQVVEGRAEDFMDEPADLIVANIHYDVIRRLLDRRAFLDKDRVIISGLMRTQSREIKTQLERRGFKLLHEWDHEMTWFTMLAEIG